MIRNNTLFALAVVLCASVPARAEIDLSGSWASINHEDALERGAGPNPDDWAGLPFNESGRAKALSFSQSIISMPERTCWFQTQWHIAAGPFSLRMWAVPDPITGKVQAWVVAAWETRAPMTIWMDGRPHPSKNAPHDQTGFTTGVWNGNELIATTTHLKTGYIRRNGAASSDQATITTHFRRHGEMLTLTLFMEDPVYLTEPYILTRSYNLSTNPVPIGGPPCIVGDEGVNRAGSRTTCRARTRSSTRSRSATEFLPTRRSEARRRCIRSIARRSGRNSCVPPSARSTAVEGGTMRRFLVPACLAVAAAIAPTPAAAQDVAITNARVIVGSGQVIESGTIIVRGEKSLPSAPARRRRRGCARSTPGA